LFLPGALIVVPVLYALTIRDNPSEHRNPEEAERQLATDDEAGSESREEEPDEGDGDARRP
jgi:hypothetical protein